MGKLYIALGVVAIAIAGVGCYLLCRGSKVDDDEIYFDLKENILNRDNDEQQTTNQDIDIDPVPNDDGGEPDKESD